MGYIGLCLKGPRCLPPPAMGAFAEHEQLAGIATCWLWMMQIILFLSPRERVLSDALLFPGISPLGEKGALGTPSEAQSRASSQYNQGFDPKIVLLEI